MIDVHYWPTPNGKKVMILLEELGLPYTVVPCRIGHAPAGGGEPVSVFESGAILMYLAEKAGRYWPQDDVRAKYEVAQWVIWQMANQGPKFGEQGHFLRAPDSAGDMTYARTRFNDEVHRLFGVMNNRLYDRRYLAGEDYSIADMAAYPWTAGYATRGIDLDEFKYFKRWFEELSARPAVEKGMAVTAGPQPDPATLSPEARERIRQMLYNQRARPAPVA